jgi:hypothetical protein
VGITRFDAPAGALVAATVAAGPFAPDTGKASPHRAQATDSDTPPEAPGERAGSLHPRARSFAPAPEAFTLAPEAFLRMPEAS